VFKTSLLAAALLGLALMPSTVWAQRGRGFVGGGRGGGGPIISGNRGGYYGPGTARALPIYGRGYNAYGYNYANHGRNRGWYGYGWGWPYGYGYGLGLGLGYGGYGGYSGYGGYGYELPLSIPYFSSSYIVPVPQGGYEGPDLTRGMDPQPQLSQGPMPRVLSAAVDIYVPSKDAELWFNGVKTTQAGQKRSFVTPELQPGKSYTYDVRAKWMEDGKEFDQTHTVAVRSGAQAVYAFFAAKKEQLPPPVEVK
jgi:uncharacterized protein (TIGR03000 family)